MKSRVVSPTELKAKCLALLDEVNDRGHTITVTKRGPAREEEVVEVTQGPLDW
jgi:hypothetical protein